MELGTTEMFEVWLLPTNESYQSRLLQTRETLDKARELKLDFEQDMFGDIDIVRVRTVRDRVA